MFYFKKSEKALYHNSIDIRGCDLFRPGFKADIVLCKNKNNTISGTVIFDDGTKANDLCLKLYCVCKNMQKEIGTTITDECGNYEFEVPCVNPNLDYKVVVIDKNCKLEDFYVIKSYEDKKE